MATSAWPPALEQMFGLQPQQAEPNMSMPGEPPALIPPDFQRGPTSLMAKFRPAPGVTQPDFAGQQRMPAGAMGGSPMSKEAVQSLVDQQQGGVDTLAGYAKRYAELMKNKSGDLTPLLRLIDTTAGSETAKGYESPQDVEGGKLAKQMAMQKMVNDARTPIASELIKQYASDNSLLGKSQAAYYKQLTDEAKRKASRVPTGIADENGFPIDLSKEQVKATSALRNTIMGVGRTSNQKVNNEYDKLMRYRQFNQLVSAIPEKQANPQEMNSLATSMAGLVTNSNVITDANRKEFLPDNVENTVAGIAQFLASKPTGSAQQEFIKRWQREAGAEGAGSKHTLHTFIDKYADAVDDFEVPKAIRERTKAKAHQFVDEGYNVPSQAQATATATAPAGEGSVVVTDGNRRKVIPKSKATDLPPGWRVE